MCMKFENFYLRNFAKWRHVIVTLNVLLYIFLKGWQSEQSYNFVCFLILNDKETKFLNTAQSRNFVKYRCVVVVVW